MKLINADKVIEKLKEHKSLFCKNRDEFRALPDKDKARVDEIDTCIAELVNAEEVQTTEADTDTISRAKAIDAVQNRHIMLSKEKVLLINDLEKLPPAQLGTNLAQLGTDCISRQAAINVIERTRAYIGHNMERAVGAAFIEILDGVGEDIGRLPPAQPAQPERIEGHWTVKEGELAFWDVCSACRKMIIHRAPHYSFCPNCGADMREVTE